MGFLIWGELEEWKACQESLTDPYNVGLVGTVAVEKFRFSIGRW
jgi:hypothetical protein